MKELSFGTIVASFTAGMLAIMSTVLIVNNTRLQDEADKYKNLTEVNREMVIQTQLKYEGAKDENTKLRAELDEAKAKERAQAKIRASRDRAARDSRARSSRTLRSDTSDAGRQNGVGVSSNSRGANSSSLGVRDITMYCPTGSRTASGKWPTRGMVATISRSIPFGTRISIDGLGTFVVEDRIGHGSEFDIFTPSCSEAKQFGRKHRAVRILG